MNIFLVFNTLTVLLIVYQLIIGVMIYPPNYLILAVLIYMSIIQLGRIKNKNIYLIYDCYFGFTTLFWGSIYSYYFLADELSTL